MVAVVEPLVELAERGQDRARLHDRVDPELRARAVGRSSPHLDLEPGEPLVRSRDLHLGRLGHDRGVGLQRPQRLLHAKARVLLVGHRGHHHVPGQVELAGVAAGHKHGRNARLHVIRAAAVDSPGLDTRLERLAHLPHAHGVEVPTQEQRGAPALSAGTHEHAGPPGRLLEQLDLESRVARPARHEGGGLALPRGARLERRVDGVDRDQRPGQLDNLGGAHRGHANECLRLGAQLRGQAAVATS